MNLILDIDGVLITTPSWKPDIIDDDGYSKFNLNCVLNLNILLSKYNFKIWLSSSRRKGKTIEEFNTIFNNRGILTRIVGFLPNKIELKSRKQEIEQFINSKQLESFLIIDDDKSLNDLKFDLKSKLVLTESFKGFNDESLKKAISILKKDFTFLTNKNESPLNINDLPNQLD